MGLDVVAYSKLTPADTEKMTVSDIDMDDSIIYLKKDPYFPERAADIKDGHYNFCDAYHFRAGGYGGYNLWREKLAKMAGYPPKPGEEFHAHSAGAWNAESGPFWELILFTDCDGLLGTETCKKLKIDFKGYRLFAEKVDLIRFMELYDHFQKALELGSDKGVIRFA